VLALALLAAQALERRRGAVAVGAGPRVKEQEPALL